MRRAERFREQLADARSGRVVFLSHCLLNQNVRYLGGAGRAGGVGELAASYPGPRHRHTAPDGGDVDGADRGDRDERG